jgi:alpha-L-rhamnosidase
MCSFLFDTVCGIRVDGENKISIKPKPGGTLTHAKAKVLTAYGEIISGWEKEDNVIKYTFTVPANVTANLILPDGTENTLSAGSHYYRELRMS